MNESLSGSKLSMSDSSGLRKLNLGAGLLHLLTATSMLVFGDLEFQLSTSTFSLGGPPGTDLARGEIIEQAGIPLALGVAKFSLLSAFFHFLVSLVLRARYENELAMGRNRFRWVEYSLSSTLMIVLIAATTGVVDLAALIAIAFANASMILFGWIMEMVNSPKDVEEGNVWWAPFWMGCVAGVGPWLAVLVPLVLNVSEPGAQGPPGFVYGIIASIFIFFNIFALNQWLQYKGIGRWQNYLFGERVYIVLSFVAKSALAWQIFANTLIPA